MLSGMLICALCTGSKDPKYKPILDCLIFYSSFTIDNIFQVCQTF